MAKFPLPPCSTVASRMGRLSFWPRSAGRMLQLSSPALGGSFVSMSAALPAVALDAAQAVHAPVTKAADPFVCARGNFHNLRPIVAGEDDECVRRQAGAGERGQDFAHCAVHLRDVIAVVSRLAAAFELRRGHDRIMRGREREIEEEWPGG